MFNFLTSPAVFNPLPISLNPLIISLRRVSTSSPPIRNSRPKQELESASIGTHVTRPPPFARPEKSFASMETERLPSRSSTTFEIAHQPRRDGSRGFPFTPGRIRDCRRGVVPFTCQRAHPRTRKRLGRTERVAESLAPSRTSPPSAARQNPTAAHSISRRKNHDLRPFSTISLNPSPAITSAIHAPLRVR